MTGLGERLDVAATVGDIDLPCDCTIHPRVAPTNPPATWVVWLVRCCPNRPPTRLVCDPCLQHVLTNPGASVCSNCGDRVTPSRHTLIRFERINKPPTGNPPAGS